MTPAEMQAQWEALVSARASGALEIETRTNGVSKRVRYKSDAEMASALGALERQMRGTTPHTVRVAASKGF